MPDPRRTTNRRPNRPQGRPPARAGGRSGGADRGPKFDPARDRVYRRVAKQAKVFPDLRILPLNDENLTERDAAFAHALHDAVVRRWLTCEHMVARSVDREVEKLDAPVRAALLCGAAQILLMGSVPPRAANNESVAWIKRIKHQGAGGLVNAVLRRLTETVEEAEQWPPRRETYDDGRDEIPLSDGRALPLAAEALPEDPLRRLSVATSTPLGLLRVWRKSMTVREVRALALHGIVQAPTVLNTAHATEPPPPELARPHAAPGHHLFTGSREQLTELLATRADVWVQDPASSLAVESVTDLTPSLIVDACAGQGTKTRQLARAFPDARIVATDIDAARSRALRDAFKGEPRVTVIPHDKLIDWAGKADLVLLDVPCSNTGVLARRVEARYRASERLVDTLIGMQRQIVADAVRLLSQGGRILYSTCSLDPRENEEMLAWVERWHGLRPSRVERRMPGGGPGEPADRYSDGSFAALLG